MDADEAKCPCLCRYCLIYEFGVYFIDGIWLVIMLMMVIFYYREIKAYFVGNLKLQERYQQTVQPQSQAGLGGKPAGASREAMSIIPAGGSEGEPSATPFASQALNQQATKLEVVQRPAPQAQPIYQPTPPGQSAFPSPAPTAPPAKPQPPDTTVVDTEANRTSPGNVPAATKEPLDKFVLPKKPIDLQHETTGQSYFNAIMGKKPVTSISQYLLLPKQTKNQRHKDHKKEKKNKTIPEDRDRKRVKIRKIKDRQRNP